MERVVLSAPPQRRPQTEPTHSLTSKRGRIYLDNGNGEVPVRIVWARPLSGRGKEIAFLDDSKQTVAMIDGLHVLDSVSRAIAAEALEYR